jgi:hypothetical protein
MQGITTPMQLMAQYGGAPGLLAALGGRALGVPGINTALQTGYGGNVQKAQEVQDAMSQVYSAQSGSLGEEIRTKLLGFSQKYPQIQTALSAIGLDLNKPESANGIGSVLQSIMPFAPPEVQSAISVALPDYIADATPLAEATYLANNGKFDQNIFNGIYKNFMDHKAKGTFGNVPANIAVSSLPHVMRALGSGVTMEQVGNVSKGIDAYISKGLATSYGDALKLMSGQTMQQIAKNPQFAENHANALDNMFNQYGLTAEQRQQVAQAPELAERMGTSATHLMLGIATAGAVQNRLGSFGERYAKELPGAFADSVKGRQAKLLAAGYTSDKNMRAQIDNAMQIGGERGAAMLAQISEQVRHSPYASRANSMDEQAATLINKMNPDLQLGFMNNAVTDFVKRTGGTQLMDLRNNPDELVRRIKEQDFTGLDTKTVRVLTQNPRLVASIVGLGKNTQQAAKGIGPVKHQPIANNAQPVQPTQPVQPIKPLETKEFKPVQGTQAIGS